MEKRTPHYALERIRALIAQGRVKATASALLGARSVGMDYPGMLELVSHLQGCDFYKSMTSHADHRVWQDVYRPQVENGWVYLKLSVMADVLIVSFKEL